MKEEILELFRLASKFFFKKYKATGGSQSQLAKEFGVTQSYLSSVMNGSRSASFELYNRISERLYGPLDKFIGAGRRIQEGKDPMIDDGVDSEDSVEKLIAQLTYYIMDYKRLQKELSKQKVFYETIIENLQSGVLVTDKNNKIVYINRYMEKMFDMKANKIVGTTPFATPYNGSNVESVLELEMEFLSHEYSKAIDLLKPVYYERVPIKTNTGQVFYNSGWVIPLIKDNEYDGMVCTLRDATTTQNLSDLLYQSLEQRDEGIWLIHQDNPGDTPKSYFANETFYKIFDIEGSPKSEEVPFTDVIEMMKREMKNADEWESLEKEALANKREKVDCKIKMNDGKKYQWSSKPLANKQGRHIGRYVAINKI